MQAPDVSSVLGSQARITCEPKVANCLDTLKLSLYVDWNHSNFLDRLELIKQKAQAGENDSEPVDLAGYEWNVMRSGTSRYNYRLIHGDIKILLNRRKPDGLIPNVRLEIGSISCWFPGYFSIYKQILKMLEIFGGILVKERVSELHLAADFIGVDLKTLPIIDQDHWITRAHSFSANWDRRKFTGVSVGKGDFMLRIYDKVEELKTSTNKQDVFADAWGLETFNQTTVTRVEFQIRRPILREFQPVINSMDDLADSLDSLWKYCAENWCRLTENPVDRNHHQSRAETHPFWSWVQSVSWSGLRFVHRVKQYLQKDIERLKQQATGVCMTIAAVLYRDPDDLEGIIAFAQGAIEGHLRKLYRQDKRDFRKRMSRKLIEALCPQTLAPAPF